MVVERTALVADAPWQRWRALDGEPRGGYSTSSFSPEAA